MEFECGEAGGFGVGLGGDSVGLGLAVLLDGEVKSTGVDGFEGGGDVEGGGFVG